MESYLSNLNIIVLILILIVSIVILSRSADFLVKSAVGLSRSVGVSEIIIGATIVSLGTTLPEFTSSIIAAAKGEGGFSLGNSVGSTITNICLVLGIGAIFGLMPVNKRSSKSYLILTVTMIVLIVSTIPTHSVTKLIGIVFVLCVPIYIFYIIKSEKKGVGEGNKTKEGNHLKKNILRVIFIIVSAILVSVGASVLTASVEVIATRIGVADAIISSTIVAFGTSIPELSTVISSAKKGFGELAIGNIMGANILNILFVLGTSAVISPEAIKVPSNFYYIHFPASIIALIIFGYLIYNEKKTIIRKREGLILIGIYFIYILVNVISI